MNRRHLIPALLVLCLTLPARAADHIALDIQWAGLDALASTPKDAYLRAAIKALGPRLAAIPAETNGDPEDGIFLSALWEAVRGSARIRLAFNDDDPATPRFRLFAEIRTVEPERAADLARALSLGAEQDGHILENDSGLRTFTSDNGDAVAFGIRAGALILTTNGAESPREFAGRVEHAPADAPLLLRAHVNGAALSSMIEHGAASADPVELAQARALLSALGLAGDNAISADIAMWRGGRGLEGAAVCRNARAHWGRLAAAGQTLTPAFLARIPADATWCAVSVTDLAALLDTLLTIATPEDRSQFTEQTREFLGFDLRDDFLAHVGPRIGLYQSERTGGGGLMSTIALAELKDPAAFAASHDALVGKINGLAASLGNGYIRIDQYALDTQPVFTLSAPGIPLPLAVTWGIRDRLAVKALSPTAFLAALAIAAEAGPGIAANRHITDRVGDPATLIALSYTDTSRKARSAVGAMTTVLLMAGNAARLNPASPALPALPSSDALLAGIHPAVNWSRWAGDDMLIRWTCDDSLTVAAGLILAEYGSIGSLRTMPMMLGVMLPALAGARAGARDAVAQGDERFVSPVDAEPRPEIANLQAINLAIVMHCAQSGDVYPDSLDQLVEAGLIDRASLRSPYGPSIFPGGADYVMHLPAPEPPKIDLPADTIIVVDVAAMGSDAPRIPVCTADGAVHLLTPEQLDAMLAEPQNAGMKSALHLD